MTATATRATGPFVLPRAPRTDDELWWAIRALWGVSLPRVAVCPDHVSPFEAVSHAFFGKEPNFAVWYASRGSGKSLALATLGLTKAFVDDVDVTILGGSMTQSLNVREHMRKLMKTRNAPVHVVAKDQATIIEMHTGRAIKPLPASQTTVRGPHPPLQLLDEVDEMEKPIYDASLGQAMEQTNVHGDKIAEYIVASSTWQNPEGTFTQVIEDARERGLPVFTWCWRELLEPHGWMSKRFIDAKRRTVSAQMWHTEYELNEPASGSRAVDLDKVEKYFTEYGRPIEERHLGNGDHDEWTWERPENGLYAIGADWAKEKDKTVIVCIRYDVKPHRVVKLIRINRRPWDVMIGMFNKMTQDYQAIACHDKTGIGNVVADYIDYSDTTQGFVMIGRPRTQLLLDYITAFEHGRYNLPIIPKNLDYPGMQPNPLYRAHRSVTVADVYAPGKWNGHLPDEFAALALAHRAIETMPVPTTMSSEVPKYQDGRRKIDRALDAGEVENVVHVDGVVSVVDERYDGMTSFLVGSDGSRDQWSVGNL